MNVHLPSIEEAPYGSFGETPSGSACSPTLWAWEFTLSFLSNLNLDMNSYFSKALLHPFLNSFSERDQGPVSGNTCVPQHVLSTSPRQPQVLEHVHMLGSLPSSLSLSLQRALFLELPYHSSQLPKSLGQSLPKALLYPFYSLVTTVFKVQ